MLHTSMYDLPIEHCLMENHHIQAQRNRYPETDCNGTPSLSNTTDFYVNVTETFSDGARVCAMVIDERYSTVPSTYSY